MNTPTESLPRLRSISFWCLGLTLFVASGVAWADELPIVLSNENIGMSGAEVEASQPSAPAPETSPPTPTPQKADASDSSSEFVSAEPSEAPKTSNPASPAVTSYPVCVERAIRGGADYDASVQVCQILFPDASS